MKKIYLLLAFAVFVAGCTPEYTNPDLPRPTKGGGDDAPVIVEEFGDFQCPACGQASILVRELQEQYGDQVQWRYLHYPLTQIHPFAFNAAMAAECAHDQGKFWEMHDIMFDNQRSLSRGDLRNYAEQIGLNLESYDACFKSRAKTDIVRSDTSTGNNRGVNSTPTFYVNGERLASYPALESFIQQILDSVAAGEDDDSEGADSEPELE